MSEGLACSFRVTTSPGRAEEWLARALGEQLGAARGSEPGLSGWARRIGLGRAVHIHVGWTDRRVDVVVAPAPDPDTAIRYLQKFPMTRLVVLHSEIAAALAMGRTGQVVCQRYLLPDWAYDADGGRLVFATTESLRLESRPRIVYAGDLSDGRGITRAFHVAEHALRPGEGELVIPGGLSHRAQWAPIAHRLGLAEQVVFAPELSQQQYAGLLHGADVLIAPEAPRRYPAEMLMGAAAGVPIVALDEPLHRLASADGALLVRRGRDDAWPAAVTDALVNGRRRERMIRVGKEHAEQSRLTEAWASWTDFLCPPREAVGASKGL